jgi:hypothetical protein
MLKFHLWPEDPLQKGDLVELAATLEKNSRERQRIWFRLSFSQFPVPSGNLDSFVLAVLFTLMEEPADLEIHGEVSPSLLFNLAEFQKAWALWLPQKYHSVELLAETERDLPRVEKNEAIMGFSGGVDSAFTAWQHRMTPPDRQPWKLVAGVMVHGFDIPINQPDVFARAAEKSRIMLSSIGMELIPVYTNLRELHNEWDDSHGTALAACLMMFHGRFNTGLIASSDIYKDLILPWGSNPLTDRMLSNNAFEIIHDGAGTDRIEKVMQLSRWPEAKHNLRVCWEGQNKDRNCCRCQKCVANILIINAVGQGNFPAFPYNITDREIRHLKFDDLTSMDWDIKLLANANIPRPTLRAMKVSLLINRVRVAANKYTMLKWLVRLFGGRWFLDPADSDPMTAGK